MSSGAAGKFQDHYKILNLDPKSDSAAIQAAHSRLVKLFHPSNGKEPSHEQYAAINLAYEVLTDPQARQIFDSVRGGSNLDDQEIIFSGMHFFNEMKNEVHRRNTLLCVLYDVRKQMPRTPVLTMRQLEQIIRMSDQEMQLALWYLKTLGWVLVDDKSKLQITAQGMDYLQANPPSPKDIFPFLKKQEGTETPPAGLASLMEATTIPPPMGIAPAAAPAAITG